MERCERDHDATSYDELWFSRHVGRLFCLFHNLAERGFSPFDSREATYVEERQAPDWGNLLRNDFASTEITLRFWNGCGSTQWRNTVRRIW